MVAEAAATATSAVSAELPVRIFPTGSSGGVGELAGGVPVRPGIDAVPRSFPKADLATSLMMLQAGGYSVNPRSLPALSYRAGRCGRRVDATTP